MTRTLEDLHARSSHRGRARRPVLRRPGQAALAGLGDHPLGAQRPRRRIRLRCGVLGRDAGRDRPGRPRGVRRHLGGVRPVERHRHPLRRRGPHLRRSRVRRPRPQPAAGGPAEALRRARGRRPVRHAGAAGRGALGHPRPGGRRRRRPLGHPGGLPGRLPAGAGRAALPLHVALHRPGLRGLHLHRGAARLRRRPGARLPVLRPPLHLHRRTRGAGLAAGRLRGPGRAGVRARRERRGERAAVRGDPGRPPGRPPADPQRLPVDPVHHRPQRLLAARERRPARRRRPHRALLDRLGYQARHGGRPRPRREPARTPHRGRGVGRVRVRAQAGGGVDPAGRAGQPGVVRDDRPLRRPGARPVRLQPAHPQPPGHLRQPAGPGRRLRGRRRRRTRRRRRR